MEGTFGFPASEMSTPLRVALKVSAGDRAADAGAALRQVGFDQAPVFDEGRLTGWVRASQLGGRGFVSSSVVTLDRCVVLARSASVGDAVTLLANRHLIFLAGSAGIEEFVVVSDLDRHVVRSYLYVLLSAVEFRLATLVRARVPEESIIQNFRDDALERYRSAQKKGRETHAVEYLYLLDYSYLIGAVPELQEVPGWSPRDQRRDLNNLNRLRNVVAHPSKSLTGDFSAQEIADLAAQANEALSHLRAVDSSA